MREPRHILDLKKQQIESGLIALFASVRRAIDEAVSCLQQADKSMCQTVIDQDSEINESRRLLEQDCLVAIASQQPVASDLRDVVGYMRMSTELERIGDYASDIAASVLQIQGVATDGLQLQEVTAMAQDCIVMLDQVNVAFRERSVQLAREAAKLDDQIDRRQQELVQRLFEHMKNEPELIPDASRMLWIAHNLERCGDRATNIAEQLIFIVEGASVELN